MEDGISLRFEKLSISSICPASMLVDAVSDVVRINRKPERAEPSVDRRIDPELVRETLWMDEQSLTILDWLRILDM